MKVDPKAIERQERAVAEQVAAAGMGTRAGKQLLDRALDQGLNVRTIKRLARSQPAAVDGETPSTGEPTDAAPPAEPKRRATSRKSSR